MLSETAASLQQSHMICLYAVKINLFGYSN